MNLLKILKEVAEEYIIKEDLKAGTFIGYHRTFAKNPKDFNKGYKAGGDTAMFGPGLYMFYELEDVINNDSTKVYGPTIVEFEIKNNGKFLIIDKKEIKKVYRDNYTIINQLKKIIGGNFINFYKKNKKRFDDIESNMYLYDRRSDLLVQKILNLEDIENYIDGISFIFPDTSFVPFLEGMSILILYETNLANPIRYTIDEGKTWINLKDKSSYKIGQDERGTSKKYNFYTIADKGDFSKVSKEDREKYIDKLIKNIKTSDLSETDPIPFISNTVLKYATKEQQEAYLKAIYDIGMSGRELRQKHLDQLTDEQRKNYIGKQREMYFNNK